MQYLENSYRIKDQRSISKALNNLAILSKIQGVHAYYETRKSNSSPTSKSQAKERLNAHLGRAIHYLEQHLLIEENLSGL